MVGTTLGGDIRSGVCFIEATMAATPRTMHRAVPTIKNYPAQTVRSAEVENP